MRNAVVTLAITVALTLVTGSLRAETPKAPKPDVGAGRIAWFDITTSDMAKAKAFYGNLFGWQFAGMAGTEYAVQIVSHDVEIGTIRVAEGKISAYNGVVYVQVDDIEASCAKAKELGATIPPGFPFNLDGGRGAVALVVDPTGHPIGMYSRKPIVEKAAPGK